MHRKLREAYHTILAQEEGYVRKDPGGRIMVALAYPNTYYVGMSNLGLHAMYRLFNARPDTLCERVFIPSPEVHLMRGGSAKPLVTLESRTPVREFDILAFSCSFENDYLGCLGILEMSGIPLRSSDRDDTHPLVVMGGACTFFNVEPMASFIDCFLCGEGELLGQEFLDAYREWVESGGGKEDLLLGLRRIEGMYIPSLYEYGYDGKGRISGIHVLRDAPDRIHARITGDLDRFETSTAIFNRHSEFSGMFLAEVSRGCPRGCKFCLLSTIYRPFRQRGVDSLLAMVRNGVTRRERIGLVGASLTDYADLEDLCQGIRALGGKVSLCSLRADHLTDGLLDVLVQSDIRTVTLAPETGSEQLRASIGKADMTDDRIMDGVERLVHRGIPLLKLYFMVGLPGETTRDVEAIVRLVKRIRHCAVQAGKGKRGFRQIALSVSSFVPKPLTRFQFHPMESTEQLAGKIRYIARETRSIRGVTCTHDVPKWSYIQALLSRGDRRVGEVLLQAHQEHGNWHRAFRSINLSPDFYLFREMDEQDTPPWMLWMP
ncbi:MAG: radical SAM protein [bacterium]